MKRFVAVFAVLVVLVCENQVLADNLITGLYNTGVDNSGTVLPNGAVDPHYSLVTVPGGPSIPLVMTSASGFPVSPAGPWIADDSLSAWISPSPISSPSGQYVYQTTFQSSQAGSVTIGGYWAVDDFLTGMSINGSSAGYQTIGYQDTFTQWTAFTITANVNAGTNTMDFGVVNYPAQTGLRLEFLPLGVMPTPSGPAPVPINTPPVGGVGGGSSPGNTSSVPEPTSLIALAGLGAMGLIGYGWKKHG